MTRFDIKQFIPCEEGLEYYESKPSFEEAWRECERGDWMLWMAKMLGVDSRTLTRAKALCASTVRHLMTYKRSTDAIDAALRYADGEISREELDGYARATAYADDAAAAYAAYADDAAAAAAAYADDAAAAAAAAAAAYADAAAVYAADAAAANQRQTADICREVLTDAVFEKVNQKSKIL
jgi:hypothetical protein